MKRTVYEVNFDGIVGPTHNYGGLSYGNIASKANQDSVSNPQAAALQGLKKMQFLSNLGIKQAVFPPHERPHLPTLRALGFKGNALEIIAAANRASPALFKASCSAAAMWTANAATVCPSADSADQKVHFVPANLFNYFHRAIEASLTEKVLKIIFNRSKYFVHHPPLAGGGTFSDEGAANHIRFCTHYEQPGVQLFVYGRHALETNKESPRKYPARQTYEASAAIARQFGLSSTRAIFAQQHPKAIDAGAFHNDVVAVSNQNVFFFHEHAFLNREVILDELRAKYKDNELFLWQVADAHISLEEAIRTYVFNSQIVSLPDGAMALIAPSECQANCRVKEYLESQIRFKSNPIKQLHFLELRQSMCNGGGPACLRLRVVLTEEELRATHSDIFLNESLYAKLEAWIKKYYRDRLSPEDLADPQLYNTNLEALDELTKILQLGSIYSFQICESKI